MPEWSYEGLSPYWLERLMVMEQEMAAGTGERWALVAMHPEPAAGESGSKGGLVAGEPRQQYTPHLVGQLRDLANVLEGLGQEVVTTISPPLARELEETYHLLGLWLGKRREPG